LRIKIENQNANPVDDRIAVAQKDFIERVAKSNGAVKFEEFTKTDGYEQDFMGMKIYMLEWKATVSVERTIYKSGDGIMGYWQDFHVMNSAKEQNPFFPGKRFDAGKKIYLTGQYSLQKTENGWRVEGYEVKRQQW